MFLAAAAAPARVPASANELLKMRMAAQGCGQVDQGTGTLFKEGTRPGYTANCRDGEGSFQPGLEEGNGDRGKMVGSGSSAEGNCHPYVRFLGGVGCHGTRQMATDSSPNREQVPRLELPCGHASCLLLGQSPGMWVQRRGISKTPPAGALAHALLTKQIFPVP